MLSILAHMVNIGIAINVSVCFFPTVVVLSASQTNVSIQQHATVWLPTDLILKTFQSQTQTRRVRPSVRKEDRETAENQLNKIAARRSVQEVNFRIQATALALFLQTATLKRRMQTASSFVQTT